MTTKRLGRFMQSITREQNKDTGMAMVLLLLLFGILTHSDLLIKLAIPVLVIDMVVPVLFYPVAIVWLGGSKLLGTIVSKFLLTIIFFGIVTPIGLVRRIMGKDELLLKKFKVNDISVMKERIHTFIPSDIEKPF